MIVHKKSLGLQVALAAAVVAVSTGKVLAGAFVPGDLVVNAYGNARGSTADQSPTPITLLDYSTSGGSPVQSLTLNGVDGEYGSASEGNMQLSGNGQYLSFMGYSAGAVAAGIQASSNTANGTDFAPGTPFGESTINLAQSADTNVPRVVAFVDSSGNTDSSTVLNDVYSTNNPRSAYSANGSTFYSSGQGSGSSDQGVFFGSRGMNTVTSPGTPPASIYNTTQTRFVTAFGGNLYQSIDNSAGTDTGIWKYNGMPTSTASPTRIIPANGVVGGSTVFFSPEGFYFANANTLYVADTGDPKAGSLGDGGIQKWTFNGSSWALQYTLTPTFSGWVAASKTHDTSDGESGFAGTTGKVVGTGPTATVDLFAVSYTLGDGDPNGLYSITDALNATSGAGENFTELEVSSTQIGGQTFKGVAFAPVAVPEPATGTLLCAGSLMLLKRRRRNA